mgnify:CR=1 FL=1
MADKKPYHHRNLPAVLREVTAELVSERGPAGFSLREVARRAGVSHAAPAHHFGDTRGLLTSLAAEGCERLTSAVQAASEEPDPQQRLRACGNAYVRTALESPGHFAVIFRDDLLDGDDPALMEHGSAAFATLLASMEALRDELNPALDVDAAALMCWSSMQGLVTLAPVLAASDDEHSVTDLTDAIEGVTSMMLAGFLPR